MNEHDRLDGVFTVEELGILRIALKAYLNTWEAYKTDKTYRAIYDRTAQLLEESYNAECAEAYSPDEPTAEDADSYHQRDETGE